jgi:hypothetical protein
MRPADAGVGSKEPEELQDEILERKLSRATKQSAAANVRQAIGKTVRRDPKHAGLTAGDFDLSLPDDKTGRRHAHLSRPPRMKPDDTGSLFLLPAKFQCSCGEGILEFRKYFFPCHIRNRRSGVRSPASDLVKVLQFFERQPLLKIYDYYSEHNILDISA